MAMPIINLTRSLMHELRLWLDKRYCLCTQSVIKSGQGQQGLGGPASPWLGSGCFRRNFSLRRAFMRFGLFYHTYSLMGFLDHCMVSRPQIWWAHSFLDWAVFSAPPAKAVWVHMARSLTGPWKHSYHYSYRVEPGAAMRRRASKGFWGIPSLLVCPWKSSNRGKKLSWNSKIIEMTVLCQETDLWFHGVTNYWVCTRKPFFLLRVWHIYIPPRSSLGWRQSQAG